ncbi:MAG: ABC transporter permease [Elusimicrobiota bacterium]
MLNLNRQFFRGIRVVAEKNIRIYYSKAPVLMFGILFPLFLFLAFYLGRNINMLNFFPGLVAMSLFFVSSAVGPLITPWEKSFGTYERLLSFPVSINTLILGNVAAGMIFGIILNVAVLIPGLIFLEYTSAGIIPLAAGIILSSFAFSSLGVLIASPPARSPSHIMMFSSLVRFPLVFISGIFVPLQDLRGAGRILSYFSPVTYLVDILNYSLRGANYLSLTVDFLMLFVFGLIFLILANRFHKNNMIKGL